MDGIDDCWDPDIYDENCPDTEYDYEANEVEKPEDIDVDEEIYEDENGHRKLNRYNLESDMTIREYMIYLATQAFKEGWEYDYYKDQS